MRVVSWNLQHGVPDPAGPPTLARGLDPLRGLGGDVYGLQELDRGHWRSRGAHQAEVVADALEAELVWARAKRWLWASQSNALVVRGEVVTSEVIRLPGRGETRVAALAVVVAGGERCSVATTHLSLDRPTALRQLGAVLQALAGWPAPRVLMGDLNLVPEEAAPLAQAAGFVPVDGPPTVNARAVPDRRLDHVLVDGFDLTASGVAKLPLSDHLAVWADLA